MVRLLNEKQTMLNVNFADSLKIKWQQRVAIMAFNQNKLTFWLHTC